MIKKKKSPWIVKSNYTTRKEMEKEYGKNSGYHIEDFQEIEISIIRKNNKLGQESYGWNGLEKIILFDDGIGNPTQDEIKWCEKVAQTVASALNAKKL